MILHEEGLKAKHVRTEKEKNFYGKTKQCFQSKKIKHYVNQNETKANYTERVIKPIKTKIARYMSFLSRPIVGKIYYKRWLKVIIIPITAVLK
jgi:hypothetical protein